jgi:hypothetical protein
MKSESEDRIDSIISTIRTQHDKFIARKLETINTVKNRARSEKIITMHEGQIRNSSQKTSSRIEEYESMRDKISTNAKDITLVAIKINA